MDFHLKLIELTTCNELSLLFYGLSLNLIELTTCNELSLLFYGLSLNLNAVLLYLCICSDETR